MTQFLRILNTFFVSELNSLGLIKTIQFGDNITVYFKIEISCIYIIMLVNRVKGFALSLVDFNWFLYWLILITLIDYIDFDRYIWFWWISLISTYFFDFARFVCFRQISLSSADFFDFYKLLHFDTLFWFWQISLISIYFFHFARFLWFQNFFLSYTNFIEFDIFLWFLRTSSFCQSASFW